jgi:hypothetical protein
MAEQKHNGGYSGRGFKIESKSARKTPSRGGGGGGCGGGGCGGGRGRGRGSGSGGDPDRDANFTFKGPFNKNEILRMMGSSAVDNSMEQQIRDLQSEVERLRARLVHSELVEAQQAETIRNLQRKLDKIHNLSK